MNKLHFSLYFSSLNRTSWWVSSISRRTKLTLMGPMSSMKELPGGFRLNPKDEDLINIYLMRKLQGIPDPLGNCLIPELNIYNREPWDLIPLFNEMSSINSDGMECFFFCPPYKSTNRGCNKRKIADGKAYWHETGKGRQSKDTDKLEWAKRIFCHRVGTQKIFEQTNWVMHEFRLKFDQRFVLCRITEKKPKNSTSAAKKRKAGSTHTEFVQVKSPKSCILNHTPKKAKNQNRNAAAFYCRPQNNIETPQEASSEASVHMNAIEIPTLSPVFNTNTADDFLARPFTETEAQTPESDIISHFYGN